MSSHTVDRDKEYGNENFTSQFLDAPDILECLYEFFHGLQTILKPVEVTIILLEVPQNLRHFQ